MFFEKTPSAITKGRDCSKSDDPVGPKFLNDKGTWKNNGLSIGPVSKTVDGKPQGNPPKGKYALIKSKTANAANNTKKLFPDFTFR